MNERSWTFEFGAPALRDARRRTPRVRHDLELADTVDDDQRDRVERARRRHSRPSIPPKVATATTPSRKLRRRMLPRCALYLMMIEVHRCAPARAVEPDVNPAAWQARRRGKPWSSSRVEFVDVVVASMTNLPCHGRVGAPIL